MSFLTLQNAHIFDVIGTYEWVGGVGYGKRTKVEYTLDKLPLKVVIGSIEVTPNINIKVTRQLNITTIDDNDKSSIINLITA